MLNSTNIEKSFEKIVHKNILCYETYLSAWTVVFWTYM